MPAMYEYGDAVMAECEAGNCVEVRITPDGVSVRSTRNPICALNFSRQEWGAFLKGIEEGGFDRKHLVSPSIS